MILRWSDQALFDLDWMYEGVFAACRDLDTTDRYYDGMIAAVEAKKDFPESAAKLYIGNIWTGDYYVVYKEYVAFYRIADDVMEVSRIELRQADHAKRFIRGNYSIVPIRSCASQCLRKRFAQDLITMTEQLRIENWIERKYAGGGSPVLRYKRIAPYLHAPLNVNSWACVPSEMVTVAGSTS